MTTLREAATQALEAMEGGADSWQLVGPAIDALRAALAEPEDDALTAAYMLGRHDSKWCPIHQHYKWCEHNGGVMGPTGWEKPMQQGCEHCNQPLYAAVKCRVCGRVTSAEPVQESAICDECGKSKHDGWALYCVKCVEPMFAPPQRLPLTEEEIKRLVSNDMVQFARAIECAHGIK